MTVKKRVRKVLVLSTHMEFFLPAMHISLNTDSLLHWLNLLEYAGKCMDRLPSQADEEAAATKLGDSPRLSIPADR